MKGSKTIFRILWLVLFFVGWFYWDVSQASKDGMKFKAYKYAKEFDAVSYATTKVAIVRSDDSALPNPTPIDNAAITFDQVEQMVRLAIEYAGGLDYIIQPGDKVLIKPNIVDVEPSGSGEVTDVRVVKALIKIVDEIDPGNMEIIIGEGSTHPTNAELTYAGASYPYAKWKKLWDKPGYQELLTDPYLDGINFRLSNLNGSPPENPWQDLVLVEIPGGGVATPHGGKYYIHKDVLNADVFITVPVMKTHRQGITVALKNQIGIAPSSRYGYWKTKGVAQDGYANRLVHHSFAPVSWTDEEIVDLANIAGIDFCVVDALACLEEGQQARRKNGVITNLVRMNSIIAGSDPVAIGNVAAQLMSLNPDDVGQITLAERVGLGTNDPKNIHIIGSTIEENKRRFKKDRDYIQQSNREWLVRGPFPINDVDDPINYPFIENESTVEPVAGENEWSESIYFLDNRIDLKEFYDNPENVVSYAFSYFYAPEDQTAELWVGSDEAMKIYINDVVVYNYDGNRVYGSKTFVSDKVSVPIKRGENRLLVKVLQKYGYYDFYLNICEPEPDDKYSGNRVMGLKFSTSRKIAQSVSVADKSIRRFQLQECYPNPFNGATRIDVALDTRQWIDISVYNAVGKKVKTIVNSELAQGMHQFHWDGSSDIGDIVASGVYFVTARTNGSLETKKVSFVR